MSKWDNFHKQNARSTPGKAIAAALDIGLFLYLTRKKTEEDIQENHPQDLFNQARGSIGKLSRIFEQMHWPMPAYEEISATIEKVGLKAYTASLLDDILPTLLDETGTKVKENVIDMIKLAGANLNPSTNNLYDEYCKHNFEEEIANQFAQAVIVTFTQKILDVEKAKSIKLMETEIATLTEKFESDVQKVLSASLPEEEEKNKLKQLREIYQEAIKQQEDADQNRQKRFHEQFNTPMEALAKRTSAQGLQPTLDVENMGQAKEFIQAFDQLVAHAKKAEIAIPGLDKAEDELEMARSITDASDGEFDGLDEQTKVAKISQNLVSAVDKIIDAMNAKLVISVPNPVENSLWQKFLNLFITTKEMKIYNKQQELLKKLAQGYEMQYEQKSLLKVEFTEKSTKVDGLNSDNARARFLNKLNADSPVGYTIDKDGRLRKSVNGENEELSKDDIRQLKEKLTTMDKAPDSLYRIKQIVVEEPEPANAQMRM